MPTNRPKRVLIADDNYSMRKVIRSFVDEQPKVEVCAVTVNGREAVDAALALKPDLLIIDAVMPELSGIEVAGVLKKSLPDSKFILFTMYGDTIGKTLVKSAGIDVVVPKSAGLSVLADRINSAVEEINAAGG
jgi:NarL family two-component system response regulator LiaR